MGWFLPSSDALITCTGRGAYPLANPMRRLQLCLPRNADRLNVRCSVPPPDPTVNIAVFVATLYASAGQPSPVQTVWTLGCIGLHRQTLRLRWPPACRPTPCCAWIRRPPRPAAPACTDPA
jgi:hypothetical protein